MNKETILEKSRQEKTEFDEREQLIQLKAIRISRAIGMALCFIILLLETIFLETSVIGFACLTIYFSMVSIENWISYALIKKKDTLVSAIIDSLFFIAVAANFISKVIG